MTTTDPTNPFVAPTARLVDYSQPAGASELRAEARVVSAGAARRWIGTGWTMFRDAPGIWIGIILLYVLVLLVVSVIPILGMMNGLLSPVFAAGIIVACDAQRSGSTPRVAHLFEGFRKNVGNLMLIGVLYLVGFLTIVAVFGAAVALAVPLLALGGSQAATSPAAIGAIVVAGLVAFTLVIPLSFTIWWSPALVAMHDLQAFDAMKRSMFACLRNWKALFVYGLLIVAIFIVALIPLGLGLFAAGPVLAISWWAGYRDIFVE